MCLQSGPWLLGSALWRIQGILILNIWCFLSSHRSHALPTGLRSRWWSKGWFLSGIAHRRNTFIIEPVDNLENIKTITYEHLLNSGLTHLVTPSSCWFPGFLSLRILQPNCCMFSSWPLTVPRGRRVDGQRRPSRMCLQVLMHACSIRRAVELFKDAAGFGIQTRIKKFFPVRCVLPEDALTFLLSKTAHTTC